MRKYKANYLILKGKDEKMLRAIKNVKTCRQSAKTVHRKKSTVHAYNHTICREWLLQLHDT